MTQKEQLDAANSKITELEGKLSTADETTKQAKADLEATQGKVTDLEQKLKAEESRSEGLASKLDASEKNARTLEKQKERFGASSNNPAPVKDAPGNQDANAGEPGALWEQYVKADATEKARMRAEHGNKLEAAAKAFHARG